MRSAGEFLHDVADVLDGLLVSQREAVSDAVRRAGFGTVELRYLSEDDGGGDWRVRNATSRAVAQALRASGVRVEWT